MTQDQQGQYNGDNPISPPERNSTYKKSQGKMVNIDVRVDVRPERKVNCCEASDCGTSELKIKLV